MQNSNLHEPGGANPNPEEKFPDQEPLVEPAVWKGKRPTKERKELLSFPSDMVVEKTLESTTQLQVDPVESECQEIVK